MSRALQEVGLSSYSLDHDIGTDASSLSAGQRYNIFLIVLLLPVFDDLFKMGPLPLCFSQLLSLARTVLRKDEIQIVVMDEVPSSS